MILHLTFLYIFLRKIFDNMSGLPLNNQLHLNHDSAIGFEYTFCKRLSEKINCAGHRSASIFYSNKWNSPKVSKGWRGSGHHSDSDRSNLFIEDWSCCSAAGRRI